MISFFTWITCKNDSIASVIGTVLMFSIVYTIIIGFIFFPIASSLVPTKLVYGWSNTIVAMNDSKAYIHSRHSVEQSDRYYYMVKSEGSYQSHWVKQSGTKIFEVENAPYIIKTYVMERQVHNWIQADLVKYLSILDYDDINLERKYEFYVPVGSVVQDFNVDLQQ